MKKGGGGMTKEKYGEIMAYMDECMSDAAHDREHVLRVLGYAMTIAESEPSVDRDLLVTACLLHDIGRAAQFREPSLDHAAVGADMARDWLKSKGYPSEFADKVRTAIRSHRYRTGGRAESIEAQILFDADKLDACGMMGLFRTVSYKAHVDEPYYTLNADGMVDFRADAPESVMQEYCWKLARVAEKMYTERGREMAKIMAAEQRRAMEFAVGEVNSALAGLRKIENYLS